MVRSKLSDEEAAVLITYVVAGNHVGAVKYVNSLLYKAGLGEDSCARPWAMRKGDRDAHPCFAIGYLDKVYSFISEVHARTPKSLAHDTQEYLTKLKKEINVYFAKDEPCQKI